MLQFDLEMVRSFGRIGASDWKIKPSLIQQFKRSSPQFGFHYSSA
jgi:hypothetical protein